MGMKPKVPKPPPVDTSLQDMEREAKDKLEEQVELELYLQVDKE